MRDIKGIHDLIMWGWTKLGAHACSHTRIFKTTIQLFVTFVFSVIDIIIVVHVELADFLSQ